MTPDHGPHATLVFSSTGPGQTVAIGEALGALLRAGDIVALHGGLGAGKTQFVRGLCAGMGLDASRVSSPTFVVMAEHDQPAHDLRGRIIGAHRGPGDTPLIHMDAYRLSGADELDTLGWDRVTAGDAALAIEWAERIAPVLTPGDHLAHVRLEPRGESERSIVLGVPVTWTQRTGWTALRALALAPGQPGRCVVCARPVSAGSGPFCSERCRLADLNLWLTGGYVVEGRADPRASQGDDPAA